jgi:WbqC-like protein family
MTLIVDIQYFPQIIFFKISYKYSHTLIEQCESYQKMSFRNRCRIAGAEGVVDLSVPIAGGRDQKTIMKEVRIATGRSWQAQHWKTIVSCYSRSPWFDYYRDGLQKLFEEPVEFLIDWDLRCLEWSLRALGMDRPILLTEQYRQVYGPEEAVDWRGKLGPKSQEKWRVPGGRPGEGLEGVARYRQVFEERIGFMPNLSILDLLFCEGKEAIRYILS